MADRTLAPGQHLFRQGDPATTVFRVLEGRLRLARVLPDGGTVTMHVARTGETFAEAALFSAVYHCDAVAETRARVEPMAKQEMLAALADDPARSLALVRDLARQVQALRQRLELRNLRPASARVLGWLALAAEGEPPTAHLDRPVKEIAAELGLSHEALYRTLARLERDGAIERRPGIITLKSQ